MRGDGRLAVSSVGRQTDHSAPDRDLTVSMFLFTKKCDEYIEPTTLWCSSAQADVGWRERLGPPDGLVDRVKRREQEESCPRHRIISSARASSSPGRQAASARLRRSFLRARAQMSCAPTATRTARRKQP